MLKTRLIPVLLLKDGFLVRSEEFSVHQRIGLPFEEVRRFNEWNVDELIYLDISDPESGDNSYDTLRNDHRDKALGGPFEILDAVSRTCFMPLTFGGNIRSFDQVLSYFQNGADKVTLNTALHTDPDLVKDVSSHFGRQAVVASIDAKLEEDGSHRAYTARGKQPTGATAVEWARHAESLGAGEILLQSMDRDGSGRGYDIELIKSVSEAVSIPVISLGGAGMYEHYSKAVKAGASAVAAANIFHFKELSDRNGKRAMRRAAIEVRL